MAQPRDFLVLTSAPALPSGGAQSGAEIARAAQLVQNFTGQNTLPALEDLLEAAEQRTARLSAAETLRRKANKITRQTGLLYEEVRRFLTLK